MALTRINIQTGPHGLILSAQMVDLILTKHIVGSIHSRLHAVCSLRVSKRICIGKVAGSSNDKNEVTHSPVLRSGR